MTEQGAWDEATALNRELGNRYTGYPDPAFDGRISETPGDGYFVAQEVRPGEWEAVFTLDREEPQDGFFRTLFSGAKTVLGEILRP